MPTNRKKSKALTPMSELLEVRLTDTDLKLVKDTFVHLVLDDGLDPKKIEINHDLIDSLLGKLEETNSRWKDLPSIDSIWMTESIKHIRQTIKNQLRDGGAPLQKRVEALRDSVTVSSQVLPEEDQQIDSTSKSQFKPLEKSSMLNKRATPIQDASPDQTQVQPAKRVKIDERSPQEFSQTYVPPFINNTMDWYSPEQRAVISNELECHKLFKEIQVKKRELADLHKRWYDCHIKSAHHSDPGIKLNLW